MGSSRVVYFFPTDWKVFIPSLQIRVKTAWKTPWGLEPFAGWCIQPSDASQPLLKSPNRPSLPLFLIQTLKYHGLVIRHVLWLGLLAFMRLVIGNHGPLVRLI